MRVFHKQINRISLSLAIALSAGLNLGCQDPSLNSDFQEGWDPDGSSNVPGSDPWQRGQNLEDPSCDTNSDCLAGEICIDNVCQMQRCTEDYSSSAPLGQKYRFFLDREFLVSDASPSDGQYWIDGYSPTDSTVDYFQSWSPGNTPIKDLSGGELLGGRPEEIAFVLEGQNGLTVMEGTETTDYALGFAPAAIATGDADGDSLDEVVAVGNSGTAAYCQADKAKCRTYDLLDSSVTILDVGMGDVDGDGYEEAVIAFADGTNYIYVWNLNHQKTGETEFVVDSINGKPESFSVGDVDEDGIDEIISHEDSTYWGGTLDKLIRYDVQGTTVVASSMIDIAANTRDIEVGDLDGVSGEEVVLLANNKNISIYQWSAMNNRLVFEAGTTVAVSGSPDRIALTDFDGDSPTGTLSGSPAMIPGNVVPTVVMQLPPYDREYSQGASSVGIGQGSSSSESFGESVSLNMGVEMGVGASLFGLVSASVGASMSRSISRSTGMSQSYSVGDSFGFGANPQIFGQSQSAVVLSSGCFHNYVYQLEDPAGRMGGTGAEMALLVPVSGQSSLWDLRRYNAMAKALDNGLPVIADHGFISGDLASYPSSPQKADGSVIPANDMVFAETPSYLASDVGSTSWSLGMSEGESNSVSTNSGISVNAGVSVFGFRFGAGVGEGWGESYSVSVGQSASFSGSIPSLPDQPTTPEDEFSLFRYAFSPYVYREHYDDRSGEPASYYVITYTVDQ